MRTSLPACMARTATSACRRVGRQMSTRSTEGSVITASRSVVVANPNWPLTFASFCGVRAEHDHLVHVGPLGVDGGVRLAKPGAQQRDLHRGQLLLRQPAPADDPAAGRARAGARPPR